MSLIAHNDEVYTKLQKKNLEITTLKHELCKLNMKNVNTKFDNSSTVQAPLNQSHRKPRSTRQLSAFRSNRSKVNISRCVPQIDTKQELSKPVTSQRHHKVMSLHKNPIRKDKHLIGRSGDKHSKACFKWVPTGRIFKMIGCSWIPMRVMVNPNGYCVTTTARDSNNTNSYQNKHYCHVGVGSSGLYAGSPSENLKVWRPKCLLSTETGIQAIRRC